MQGIFKIGSMFIVVAAAVLASMFVLDVISLDVAKDVIFKIILIILIFSISSLLITVISGDKIKSK